MKRIIDRIPSILFSAGLGLAVFTCFSLVFGGPLKHTDDWWVLVLFPAMGLIFTPIAALVRIRRLGLADFSTVGELRAAIAREKQEQECSPPAT